MPETNANWWDRYADQRIQMPSQSDGRSLPDTGDPSASSGALLPSMGATTPPYQTDEDRTNIALSMLLPRGSVQALQNTPGHVYRVEQAKKAAEKNSDIESTQRAGLRVLNGLNTIRHTMSTADPDTLSHAIGPMTSGEYFQGARRALSGAVAGTLTAGLIPTNKVPYDASYNLNNLMHHDINGLVTEFATAGKALNMSDERQKAFASTMGDMLKATTPEDALRVAQHAEQIIRDSFYLPPPAQPGGKIPPVPGEVRQGWQFIGGDAGDQNNWRRIQ